MYEAQLANSDSRRRHEVSRITCYRTNHRGTLKGWIEPRGQEVQYEPVQRTSTKAMNGELPGDVLWGTPLANQCHSIPIDAG